MYWLFIALLFVGLIQMSAGLLRLGKFVRFIPHPVMMGFVNGLAIVIFLSQLNLFKQTIDGQAVWLQGNEICGLALALVGLTMAIMFVLPRITTKIPAALTAIIGVAMVTCILVASTLETRDHLFAMAEEKDCAGGTPAIPIAHLLLVLYP